MKPFRTAVVFASASLVVMASAAESIRMDVQNTFTGPMADTSAMTVLLENDGPDVRGMLSVSAEGAETLYPVELPRGSRKKLLTLPSANYGELRFVLQTGGKDIVRTVPSLGYGMNQGGSVVLIGDDSGGLAFLRAKTTELKPDNNGQVLTVSDVYVLPQDAPGRPAAYKAFNAVVLGPGAERIGDETVQALKDYALGGGTVVFFGGASAPILEDPRWISALPGRNWRPETLASSPTLTALGDKPIQSPFTVLTPGQLAAGATVRREGSAALESERGFGLGRIVVLGYSPLEPPLSTWEGRSKAFVRFVRNGDIQRSRQFVASYLHSSDSYEVSYGGSRPRPGVFMPSSVTYATTTGGTPGAWSPPGQMDSDPFSTKLPPTGTVFGILAGYFILVVPVSFLVLRKLKRGELAWVTAPLLSLGFAGLLFRSAENLYSASLSSASQGVVVLQQGSPQALFFGSSQLFFPRGGTYDLKLKGVDSLSAVQNNEYGYGYGSDALAGFNPIDVGEIITPRLEANNLAFREMSYVQKLDDADWFSFQRIDGNRVRVENHSPYAFSGALANGAFISKPVSLAAGAQGIVKLGQGDLIPAGAAISPDDARNFTRQSGRMALTGQLTGFRPGPQIGNEVTARNGIRVIAFAQEKKG